MCKHVKSNAIVLAREGGSGAPFVSARTVGVGAGQMSRVESVKIAAGKAGAEARGSVLASDAFFPFPDGLELAAQHGVTAVAQPGGDAGERREGHRRPPTRPGWPWSSPGVRHFRH